MTISPYRRNIIMETYLFIALIFIYALTAFLLPKPICKRIWTVAYILACLITATAIVFIKLYADDTLMRVGELNWYYVLYVFGSLSIVLGLINLWMYKKGLIALFSQPDDEDDND